MRYRTFHAELQRSPLPAGIKWILNRLDEIYRQCPDCRLALEALPFESIHDIERHMKLTGGAGSLVCAKHRTFRVYVKSGNNLFTLVATSDDLKQISLYVYGLSPILFPFKDSDEILHRIHANCGFIHSIRNFLKAPTNTRDKWTIIEDISFKEDIDDIPTEGLVGTKLYLAWEIKHQILGVEESEKYTSTTDVIQASSSST